MAEPSTARKEKVAVRIELDKEEYEALKAIARREGYNLVSDYLRTLAKDIVEGRIRGATGGGEQAEVIARRLERLVADLINPFTGKIDEVLRRLSDLTELMEGEVERMKLPMKEAAREAKKAPTTAIEKLREQGVVFYEDVQWMKSPDRFFDKLRKEGALVFEVGRETIAVDPDFWDMFEEELGKISVSNVEEAVSLLEASLGEASGRLLRKMAGTGLAVYDEDNGVWVLKLRKPKE